MEMKFRVKTNDAEVLKKYGFKLPEEWLKSGLLEGTYFGSILPLGGTYHSGMDDLILMMDTIYQLTKDGLLERITDGIIESNNGFTELHNITKQIHQWINENYYPYGELTVTCDGVTLRTTEKCIPMKVGVDNEAN